MNAKGDESRLAIMGVTREDRSTYSCQASNMAGADTKLVDVNVHCQLFECSLIFNTEMFFEAVE